MHANILKPFLETVVAPPSHPGSKPSLKAELTIALNIMAVDDPEKADFEGAFSVFKRPGALATLRQLVEAGDDLACSRKVRQALSRLLIRSWGDEAQALRHALGLNGFVSLWEVSERFNDAFKTACVTLLTSPYKGVDSLEPAMIIERQLEEVSKHPDYLRGMAQIDLHSLAMSLTTALFMTSVIRLEAEQSTALQQSMMTLMRFALDSIANAREILSTGMSASSHGSAGDAFCTPEWEDPIVQKWFNELFSLSMIDRSGKPSVLQAISSTKCILLTTLIRLLPARTVTAVLSKSEHWQFAYALTGNTDILAAMSSADQELALAGDLGL